MKIKATCNYALVYRSNLENNILICVNCSESSNRISHMHNRRGIKHAWSDKIITITMLHYFSGSLVHRLPFSWYERMLLKLPFHTTSNSFFV